jgi:hypothetical protein
MTDARQTKRVRRPHNWRERFLETLAQSSNVAAAARAGRIDVSTAYKTRRSEPAFAAAWQEALCLGYEGLELDLLCRLREGDPADAKNDRKYDNAQSIRLLLSHREAFGRTMAQQTCEDEKEVIDRINSKLDMMRERMRQADKTRPARNGSEGAD